MPYKIVYGHKLHLPTDIMVQPMQTPAVEDYLSNLQKIWTDVYKQLTK